MPKMRLIYTKEALVNLANDIQPLVSYTVRFFKWGFTPDASTPRSAYLARELDYSGYAPTPAGVYGNAGVDEDAGIVSLELSSGWINNYDTATPFIDVGGYWVESDAGDVILTGVFAKPFRLSPLSGYLLYNVLPTLPLPTVGGA